MSFNREHTVKATRKLARCDGCWTPIPVGSKAVRWVGLTNGDFDSAAYHPECRSAEIALNRLAGTYVDEWIPLHERNSDDHAWLLAEHPLAAGRLGVVAVSA